MLICLTLVPVLLFSAHPSSAASKAHLGEVVISDQGGMLTVSSTLNGGFSHTMQETLQSGIPITLTYRLELRQQRRYWRDKLITAQKVQYTVRYDSLRDEYRFTGDGTAPDKRELITKHFNEVIKWMVELNGVPIASTEILRPGKHYYVRVKTKGHSVKLLFPLNYILSSASSWDFNTPWEKSSVFISREAEKSS